MSRWVKALIFLFLAVAVSCGAIAITAALQGDFGGSVMGVVGAGVWSVIALGVWRSETDKAPRPSMAARAPEKLQAQEDEVGRFCEDCGQPLIQWSAQRGFNTRTGKPNMEDLLACPGWDPMSHVTFSAWGATCGKSVTTTFAVSFTHKHDVTEPSVTCKACLVEMLRDGIIETGAYVALMERAS